MNQTYKVINLQYAVPPSLPIYSWGCLNFTLRYSCFTLRSKWGDLEGLSVDPLQFKYPELTPFQYASNRCITGIDMDGLEYYVSTSGRFLRRGININSHNIYIEQRIYEAHHIYHPAVDRVARQVGKPTQTYENRIEFEEKIKYTQIAPWMTLAFSELALGVKEGTKNDQIL